MSTRYKNGGSRRKDLSGQKFNYLRALYVDQSKPGGSYKHTYWICSCEKCGKLVSVRSSDLISSHRIDCGCGKRERLSRGVSIDLNGRTFGLLEVLSLDKEKYDKNEFGSGKHYYWVCKCTNCGRTESVRSDMLLHYGKDRCKLCMGISLGEKAIYDILTEHQVSFIHDKAYEICDYRGGATSGGRLRFDFRVTESSDCDYVIEFDGAQHYQQIDFFANDEEFESQQIRDEYKNQWCKAHNIPIIRVPYTALRDGIQWDDLIPETSKYLVA